MSTVTSVRLDDDVSKTLKLRFKKAHQRTQLINQLLRKELKLEKINEEKMQLLARRDEVKEELDDAKQTVKELTHVYLGIDYDIGKIEDKEK